MKYVLVWMATLFALVGAFTFLGSYMMWPSPRPPFTVVSAYATRQPLPKCADPDVKRLLAASREPRFWHSDSEELNLVESRRFDLQLYRSLPSQEVRIAPYDSHVDGHIDLGAAPDVDPVCRWVIDIAFERIVAALRPPQSNWRK